MTDSTEHSDGTSPLSRAEWVGVFSFWTLMAVLTAANRVADQRDVTFSAVPHAVPIALAFQQMYLWALLTPLVFWLAGRFNVEQSSTWIRITALIVIGVVSPNPVSYLASPIGAVKSSARNPATQPPTEMALAAPLRFSQRQWKAKRADARSSDNVFTMSSRRASNCTRTIRSARSAS